MKIAEGSVHNKARIHLKNVDPGNFLAFKET